MEEYIGWLVMAVLALAVVLIAKFKPSAKNKMIDVFVNLIRENEAWIVMGVYNSLPRKIKDNIDSKHVAEIVSQVIDEVVDVLKGFVSDK